MFAKDIRALRLGSGLDGGTGAGSAERVQVYKRGVTDGGGDGLPNEYDGVLLSGVVGRAGAGMGIGLERVATGEAMMGSGATSARENGVGIGLMRGDGERDGPSAVYDVRM